ncbi:MAG: hypothetical protein K2K26_07735 [Muribaculaceae bacterium]|nr:hypothetical protein [Muribaculaceae bacterium]
MVIWEIIPDILYSVQYDNQEDDEYNRIFEQLQDFQTVLSFFNEHNLKINDYYEKAIGIPRTDKEAYANKIVQEAIELESRLDALLDNVENGTTPDLHSEFKWLEGTKLQPITGLKWGKIDSSSMIRIYAAEVESNCIIIVYGGIKIQYQLSDSPLLEDAKSKVDNLISYLLSKSILTKEDLKLIAKR